jgi:hypothetical protein
MSQYACETCKHRGNQYKCSILQFLLVFPGDNPNVINKPYEGNDKPITDRTKERITKLTKQLENATFLIPCNAHSDVTDVMKKSVNKSKTEGTKRIELCFKEESERVKLILEDLYDSTLLKNEWRDSLRRLQSKLIDKLINEE